MPSHYGHKKNKKQKNKKKQSAIAMAKKRRLKIAQWLKESLT